MIIFGSILTIFESSIIFDAAGAVLKNWLNPKTKLPLGNLASPNL